MKKIFGIKNPKKGEDSDEENASYTDPAVIHATDPPRNSKGISQPHYPPPRPCHSGSPNPRRKNEGTCTVPVQGNKNSQLTENNRNSYPASAPGEPKRAPPRINITKKVNKRSMFRPKYCMFVVNCILVYVYKTVLKKLLVLSKWQMDSRNTFCCFL